MGPTQEELRSNKQYLMLSQPATAQAPAAKVFEFQIHHSTQGQDPRNRLRSASINDDCEAVDIDIDNRLAPVQQEQPTSGESYI